MDIVIKCSLKIIGQSCPGQLVFKKTNIENGRRLIFPEEMLTFVHKQSDDTIPYFVMAFSNSDFYFKIETSLAEMIGEISSIQHLNPELSVQVFQDFVQEQLTRFLKKVHLLEEHEI